MQLKEFGIFKMKGTPGASPEMAATMWPVCHDIVKENQFSTKRYCLFCKKGLLGTSTPETAAAKAPVHHDAVEEAQFAANSNSLCIAIYCDAVAITSHLADATTTC